MHKISHNHSPKLAHTSDDKETGRKPSLKRQTTGYRKEPFALTFEVAASPREGLLPNQLQPKTRSQASAQNPVRERSAMSGRMHSLLYGV